MASTPRNHANPLMRKKAQQTTQHRMADAAPEPAPPSRPPVPPVSALEPAATQPGEPEPASIPSTPQPAQPPAPDDGAASQTAAPPRITPLSLGLRILLDIFLIGAAVFVLRRPDPPAIALQPPPAPAPTATATLLPTPAPITVFVSGAVRNPALYQLPPAARVGDAIAQAGGLLPAADASLINQAAALYDGAQVHVPLPSAPDQLAASQPAAGVSGAPSAQADAAGSSDGRINVNTASASELTALPGIGQAKAENIIASRPFDSVDDLERVSGIGPKTVEQLRDLVTVQ